MSYNGSGTFVINSTGQPVVTGTVISSSTFNSLTADLGTGLSTAITKDGQTTTTAKIPFAQGLSAAVASNFAAGTVGAPSIYLSTDTTTGLYRIGANNDGFAISGVKLLDLGSALLGITGALTVSTTLGVTGASTLAALSATSGTFSTTLGVTGLITASANGKFLLANGATTGQLIADLENSGGRLVFGVANSAGTAPISSSTAYAVILNSDSGTPIELAVSSTTRLKIVSGGVVTMSAYGAGTATFSSAGVISSVSDETWKTKDGIPANPDAMLQKLAPGYWYYNDEKKETFGTDRQLGFYAQNVNAAIGPEAAPEPATVTTKNEDGTETSVTKPWGYYDRSVLAVTVMSLQKALSTIEQLTAKVAALESK